MVTDWRMNLLDDDERLAKLLRETKSIVVLGAKADPGAPAAVWFQLGIRHDGAAKRLTRAGIRVVQDRCMMPEHQRLLGG